MRRLTGSARAGILVGFVVAVASAAPPYWLSVVVGLVVAVLVVGYVKATARLFFRSRAGFVVLGAVVPAVVALIAALGAQDLAFRGPLPVLWPIALVVAAVVLQRVVSGVLDLRGEVPASCVISGSLTSITTSSVVVGLAVAHAGLGSWWVLVVGGGVGLLVGVLVSRFLATASF